jgi:predicted ATPase/class 3 adenylate cyclase
MPHRLLSEGTMADVRTLLLTDVVDSTRIAATIGDAAMARLWAAHDRMARDLLRVHGGREIDKTDGFLLLFEQAAEAAAYAMAYHQALGRLQPPLQARAGLHVGEVILTTNLPQDVALGAKMLEVDGLAKPLAARVMALAGPGQTLLTAAARAALGSAPLRTVSHGHWRLKGLDEPLELFEVGDAAAPFAPPAEGPKAYRVVADGEHWKPVTEVRHNLPPERDAFVGRREDLKALADQVRAGARLISVVGSGGVGKTRLLLRYAWNWLGEFPGGEWFCNLADCRSAEDIVAAVARALDVPLAGGDPVRQVGHAIASRGRCLVMLDNFEQVAAHAAATVGAWADRVGEAVFVVTSRGVLGLAGETTVPLAPLSEDEALVLFTTRAAQAGRSAALSDGERDDALALMRLLDALPLAIELAAARARMMSPRELLQRMSQRFKLLAAPGGGRPGRQATLQATLDWSWDLLNPDEQAALAQLAVFEGGFTLAAAESVLETGQTWPADALQALVDRSLVRRGRDERFDLLVSVQAYAAQRLQALPAIAAAAEQRHGRFYAASGSDGAIDALYTHGAANRLRALTAELANLTAAARRAWARGDGVVYGDALQAVWAVVEVRGPYALAAELARLALAPGIASNVRDGEFALARAHRIGGQALVALGQGGEAGSHYDQALALARRQGDRRAEANALRCQGILALYGGRMDEGRRLCEQALALHRELGHRRAAAVLMGNLGLFEFELGRPGPARAAHEAALAGAREVGDRRYEGIALINLANVWLQQGQADTARARYEEALAVLREVGDRATEGTVLGNLAGLNFECGRHDEALAQYEAALAIHRDVGNRRLEGLVLSHVSTIHLAQGRTADARRCLDAALPMVREAHDRRIEGHVRGRLASLADMEGAPELAREHFAAGEALLREVGDPMVLGLLLCGRARLELRLAQTDVARGLADEVDVLAARLSAGPDSELGRELAQVRELLRAQRDQDVGSAAGTADASRRPA